MHKFLILVISLSFFGTTALGDNSRFSKGSKSKLDAEIDSQISKIERNLDSQIERSGKSRMERLGSKKGKKAGDYSGLNRQQRFEAMYDDQVDAHNKTVGTVKRVMAIIKGIVKPPADQQDAGYLKRVKTAYSQMFALLEELIADTDTAQQ